MKKMTIRQLHAFLGQVPALQAEESLRLATASSIPYMSQEDADDIISSWRGVAGIENPTLEVIDWEDFKKDIKNRIA